MEQSHPTRPPVAPLLLRVLGVIAGLVAFVLLFFFLAAALVAGVTLAAALVGRLWWLGRKRRKAAEQQVITTEYAVIERETPPRPRLPGPEQ